MRFIEYADREMLFLSLANQLASELGQALRSTGQAALAVAGGTTPGPLYDLLSDVELDWGSVFVMPTDERCVAEDHPRSNLGQLRKRLLRGAAERARVLPLYVAGNQDATRIESLSANISAVTPLTSVVLGMGEDLHIASLFPSAEGLKSAFSSNAPPLVEMNILDQSEARVTLTLPILQQAMNLHLLILGNKKREALESSKGMSPELAPVRAIVENATVHWAG